MWSNFAPSDNVACHIYIYIYIYRSKWLHMTINFTPRDKIACHVEEFYHVNLTMISTFLSVRGLEV